jgi:hypothetical protein
MNSIEPNTVLPTEENKNTPKVENILDVNLIQKIENLNIESIPKVENVITSQFGNVITYNVDLVPKRIFH